jgi:hypothetical protein
VPEKPDYMSCYSFETFSAPSCRFEISGGGQSLSLNGSIYVKDDSIVFFRGRMLVELLRGAIYRDSFVVVNYLERVCYTGSNDYLRKQTGFPVNPATIMSLLTADRCEDTYRTVFNFAITPESASRILMHDVNRNFLEMQINTDNNTIKNVAMYSVRQQQPVFSAAYGDYQYFEHFNLPTVFDISTYFESAKVGIKVNLQQVILNQPQQTSIAIPANYKKIVLK